MDNPKAVKARGYGYLNAINYMAPASSGGVGNLCPHASPGCIALCLGRESGQAAMVSRATGTNNVRDSRERKARYFMTERASYMAEMMSAIAAAARAAKRARLKLAVRPNGSSDIAYEGLRVAIDASFAKELSRVSGLKVVAGNHTIFSAFPSVQFLDYTKNWIRPDLLAVGRQSGQGFAAAGAGSQRGGHLCGHGGRAPCGVSRLCGDRRRQA
jgi:TolB-like protein